VPANTQPTFSPLRMHKLNQLRTLVSLSSSRPQTKATIPLTPPADDDEFVVTSFWRSWRRVSAIAKHGSLQCNTCTGEKWAYQKLLFLSCTLYNMLLAYDKRIRLHFWLMSTLITYHRTWLSTCMSNQGTRNNELCKDLSLHGAVTEAQNGYLRRHGTCIH